MESQKEWELNPPPISEEHHEVAETENLSNEDNLEKYSIQKEFNSPQNETSTMIVQNDKNFYKIEQKTQQIHVKPNHELKQIAHETDTNQKIQESNSQIVQIKTQFIKYFSDNAGKTIDLQRNNTTATQSQVYHQNKKIILSQVIKSSCAEAVFRVQYIKYCVGVGLCLKQVIQKHNYSYESYGNGNELGHGLYIITSQGYSWSHSQKNEDDIPRQGFNTLYGGAKVSVKLEGQNLTFNFKKHEFKMTINSQILKKYSLCFCAYLHQKQDSISLI